MSVAIALTSVGLCLSAPPPPDAGLHALCTELTASWQGAPAVATGVAADIESDPAQDLPGASTWTCTYTRRPVTGAETFAGAALIRVQDANKTVDATHFAIALSDVGWVHLGLLFDVIPGSRVRGQVTRFEVQSVVYGPEPEILVMSEARDLDAFERTVWLCVDRHERRGRSEPASCVGIPIALGDGPRAKRDAERLDLRIEPDGRIALDQPRDRELLLLAPLAGVHDLGSLNALGKELGPCDEGPCLRFFTFDAPGE